MFRYRNSVTLHNEYPLMEHDIKEDAYDLVAIRQQDQWTPLFNQFLELDSIPHDLARSRLAERRVNDLDKIVIYVQASAAFRVSCGHECPFCLVKIQGKQGYSLLWPCRYMRLGCLAQSGA